MKIKTTAMLNIRAEPSLDAPVYRVVQKGTVLEAESKENGWYRLDDGLYCMAKFARAERKKKNT